MTTTLAPTDKASAPRPTTTLSPMDKASAPRPTTTLSPTDKASAPEPSADSDYPPVLWLLLGGNFLVRALGFAYPFMAYFVAQRGHGPGAVGAVLAAFGGGWVAGQLVSGWLIDRVGGRKTLVAAMLLAAVVLTLLAGAHSMPALLVGAMLVGLANNATRPVISAAIAELVPDPTKRAKVDALRYGLVMNAGSAIAGGLGGLLAVRIGIPALDVIEAAACAVFALLALVFMAPDTRRPVSVDTTGYRDKTGYRQAFSDKRLVLLLVSSVATLTAFMGIFAAMPMLMSASGLSVGAYGVAQLANALAVVAVTPVIMPWLSRRVELRPRLDIMAVAAMSGAVCMAAAAFAHTTAGFAVAAAGCAPGEIAWFVVAAGIVHRIAPSAHRGRYHGIWGMALAVAAVAAPLLAAFSLGHGGPLLVAITTLTVGLIGAALCLPLAGLLGDEIGNHAK